MIPLQWHTEKRKVSELIPYEFNPRKLSETRKQKLIDSLEKFNLAEIPAINTDGRIIAGHQRVKVLIILGRKDEEIDVRLPNRPLTEQEFKEYNISSNVDYGDWDLDILQDVFSDIDLMGLGLDLKTIPGYKSEMLTEEVEEPFNDEPPLKPVTIIGDVYELESTSKNITHRILCADSKNSDDVAKLMNGKLADMVWTDPPYNLDMGEISRTEFDDFADASGEMTIEEFISFLSTVFNNLKMFSRNGSIHYICMDWRHIFELTTAAKSVYDTFMNLCVWNKDNGGMGSFYRSKHELVFIYKNGTSKHINNFELGQHGRYRTNVWDYPSANSLKGRDEALGEHPTPKPVEMVADAILDCSHPKQTILDLFLGSGSALIGCEKTQRNLYAQELSTAYCDLSIRRWVKYMRTNDLPFKVKLNGRELIEKELEVYFQCCQ